MFTGRGSVGWRMLWHFSRTYQGRSGIVKGIDGVQGTPEISFKHSITTAFLEGRRGVLANIAFQVSPLSIVRVESIPTVMDVLTTLTFVDGVRDPHEDAGKPLPGFILKRNGMISA